jgi:hypothetical protein
VEVLALLEFARDGRAYSENRENISTAGEITGQAPVVKKISPADADASRAAGRQRLSARIARARSTRRGPSAARSADRQRR